MQILPLETLRLQASDPDYRGYAVYFLWSGEQLLYIGMSTDFGARLHRHTKIRDGLLIGKEIPFDRFTYLGARGGCGPVSNQKDKDLLARIEREYIEHYWPPYNAK